MAAPAIPGGAAPRPHPRPAPRLRASRKPRRIAAPPRRRDNDWGVTTYPFIPGHEVVGVVEAKGADVTRLKVRARAGQALGLGAEPPPDRRLSGRTRGSPCHTP